MLSRSAQTHPNHEGQRPIGQPFQELFPTIARLSPAQRRKRPQPHQLRPTPTTRARSQDDGSCSNSLKQHPPSSSPPHYMRESSWKENLRESSWKKNEGQESERKGRGKDRLENRTLEISCAPCAPEHLSMYSYPVCLCSRDIVSYSSMFTPFMCKISPTATRTQKRRGGKLSGREHNQVCVGKRKLT